MSTPKSWVCARHGYIECSRCERPLAGLTAESLRTAGLAGHLALPEARDTKSAVEGAPAVADRFQRQRERLHEPGSEPERNVPQTLSLEALRERLKRVVAQQPSCAENMNNLEARRVLRITDIARDVGVQAHKLRRFCRGEMRVSPDLQRKLSWFFHRWDRGRTVKVVNLVNVNGKRRPGAIPGKGMLIGAGDHHDHRHHHQALERSEEPPAAVNQLRVELTPDGPKLRLGKG